MSGAMKRQHEDAATICGNNDIKSQAVVEGFAMSENGLDTRPSKFPRHDIRDGEKRYGEALTLKFAGLGVPSLDTQMPMDARDSRAEQRADLRDCKSEEYAETRDGKADWDLRGSSAEVGEDPRESDRDLRWESKESRSGSDTQPLIKEDGRAVVAEEFRACTLMVFGELRDAHLDSRASVRNVVNDEGPYRDLKETKQDIKIEGSTMERTELKGDLNLPYRFTEEPVKHEVGKEGEWKADVKMETDIKEGVKEQEKDFGRHKNREGLKRGRIERDASEFPTSVDSNGNLEEEKKPAEDSEDRKVLEKDKDRITREREERDKEVEDKKPEREDFTLDGESGAKDKEKNPSGGVQKKRLLRPRGQTNSTSSRSRFRPKEPDGLHAAWRDPSPLRYRVGDGMPELGRIHKDYIASRQAKSAGDLGPTVDILIPAELVTTTNKQVRGSQLWGTDTYTDDSDIVAVLMHTGFYTPSSITPPACVSELRATIRVLPPQTCYISTLRNSLRSRAWGAANMCSYSVEKCRIVKFGGVHIDLEPSLGFSPAAAPTLSIPATERTVTTRAASSRYMQEVTIQYNLCNEPWLKYNMNYVADKGLKKSQYTSARLKRGDVLYVETHFNRYELSYEGDHATSGTTAPHTSHKGHNAEKGAPCHEKSHGHESHTANGEKNHAKTGNLPSADKHSGHGVHNQNGEIYERFRWAKCKIPMPLTIMRAKGVPLPSSYVEVLESGVHWEEIQWSQTSVWVRHKEYALARAQFLSPNVEDMED
eukprot:TRINITY_DN14626_c0_g1_i1.p1 TRINITY_DN14626_c0_g1~~TRINITY_DN14626_c0_g1_i1.p1  ORF type:complete len:765 (+),score=161.52 TRINITY_DN14626_c0_g1_i1:436-2730(+)